MRIIALILISLLCASSLDALHRFFGNPCCCVDHLTSREDVACLQEDLELFEEYLRYIPHVWRADCGHCCDCRQVLKVTNPRFLVELPHREMQQRGRDWDWYICYEAGANFCCINDWYKHSAEEAKQLGLRWDWADWDCDCWCGPECVMCEVGITDCYFVGPNRLYLPNFLAFLKYVAVNPSCECHWPECNELAEQINDDFYMLFEQIAARGLLGNGRDYPAFSPYWTSDWDGRFFSQDWRENATSKLPIRLQASSLVTYVFFYSDYHQVCSDVTSFLDSKAFLPADEVQRSVKEIRNCLDRNQSRFVTHYNNCLQHHPHPKLNYERGLIYFHQGRLQQAARDMSIFVRWAEENGIEEVLSSELYYNQGEIYLEAGNYDRAIDYLSRAIAKNPNNKEAYISRAATYLEMGEFDLALVDYFASGFQDKYRPDYLEEPNFPLFMKSFMGGLTAGSEACLEEIGPAVLSIGRGITNCLWAIMPIPGANARLMEIRNGLNNFVGYLREHETVKILGDLVPELRELVQLEESQRTDTEIGQRMGYIVGKYGLTLFAAPAANSLVESYRELKRVNYLATLEACTTPELQEAIIAQSARRAAQREAIREGNCLRIDPGKQGKHVKGHPNFRPKANQSILTHENPQALVDCCAGTGCIHRGTPGAAGLKEAIDFGEEIGLWWDDAAQTYVTTSRGTIHYANDGCHMVPAKPDYML